MNEKDILLDIYKSSNDFLLQLCEFKLNVKRIKQNINNLDNNYFEKHNIFSQLTACYNDASIQQLLDYKQLVETKLNNICDHEWMTDYIDTGPESSQQICYCKLCELTKKIYA
jgi:hypothetical protein